MQARGGKSNEDRLYPIGKFPLERLYSPFPDKVVVAIGKRGSGKTTAMKTVLASIPRCDNGLVFSPTEEANGSWGAIFPPTQIIAEFEDKWVERAIAYQLEQKRKTRLRFQRQFGRKGSEEEIKYYMPGFAIILDDCFYNTKQRNSKGLRELFFNGRHYKFFVICSLQYLKDLSPGLRGQIDYIFVAKEMNGNVRRKLYEEYFDGIIKHLQHFERIMDRHTENRGMLIFSPCSNSSKTEDTVWYFKADPQSVARVGSRHLWAWAKRHYLDPEQIGGSIGRSAAVATMAEDEDEEETDEAGVILS